MASSRDFDGRLRNLERKRSQAETCDAFYRSHNFGELPADPTFAVLVVRRMERMREYARPMDESIPDAPDPDPAEVAQESA